MKIFRSITNYLSRTSYTDSDNIDLIDGRNTLNRFDQAFRHGDAEGVAACGQVILEKWNSGKLDCKDGVSSVVTGFTSTLMRLDKAVERGNHEVVVAAAKLISQAWSKGALHKPDGWLFSGRELRKEEVSEALNAALDKGLRPAIKRRQAEAVKSYGEVIISAWKDNLLTSSKADARLAAEGGRWHWNRYWWHRESGLDLVEKYGDDPTREAYREVLGDACGRGLLRSMPELQAKVSAKSGEDVSGTSRSSVDLIEFPVIGGGAERSSSNEVAARKSQNLIESMASSVSHIKPEAPSIAESPPMSEKPILLAVGQQ
ncbi:hypothetical protein QZM22_25925 [Burkholderia oklahomensis]|uniref:hypothetical protein n=1 Tax=Burkholderia oklahomensis TaxID=342113 RepID=UPI002653D281|nr:hypothetical protein [Burkholderia oklahomensis]MDN7675842.1 hypothetical protein [Burkholderia oklahomensis]